MLALGKRVATSTASPRNTASPAEDAESAIRDGLVRAIDDAEQANAIGSGTADALRGDRDPAADRARPRRPPRRVRPDPRLCGRQPALQCRPRGRSSVGRASASQAVGRGFESLRPLWFQAIFRRSPESPDSPSPEDRGVSSSAGGNRRWRSAELGPRKRFLAPRGRAEQACRRWDRLRSRSSSRLVVSRSAIPMFDVLSRSDAVDPSCVGNIVHLEAAYSHGTTPRTRLHLICL